MADFVFNIAKGKVAYYATLPATNDALILVPIETTGLETDSTLKDYDDLSALLAGTSNEQTTMGRKTVTALVTVTVNDSTDSIAADFPDVTWTAATGNAVSKLLVCYDPDTTTGTDSSIIPLTAHDFTVTPDGNDIIAQINAAGFYGAS